MNVNIPDVSYYAMVFKVFLIKANYTCNCKFVELVNLGIYSRGVVNYDSERLAVLLVERQWGLLKKVYFNKMIILGILIIDAISIDYDLCYIGNKASF